MQQTRQTPTSDQIRAILKAHQLWVNSRYKGPRLGEQARLKGYDLRDVDFGDFCLELVIFEDVCLRGHQFADVSLAKCEFVNSDLSCTTFTQVDLSFTQFTQKTDLSDATLTPTALNQTVFNDVILNNTEFRFRMDAKPEHACQFHSCNGSGTLFTDAILNNVEFKRNELVEGDFRKAQFTNVHFEDGAYRACDFSNIKVKTLRMHSVRFFGSSFQGATIPSGSAFNRCVFDDGEGGVCSFESSVLREVDLTDSTFKNVNFRHAILDSALLSGSSVDKSDFTGTTGLYGRHKAKLDNIQGAQNAIYGSHYDYCTWARVRLIGSIPLFGVSYFAIIAICLVVSLTELYNRQVRAFKEIVAEAVASPSVASGGDDKFGEDPPASALERNSVKGRLARGSAAERTGDAKRQVDWTDKLREIELPRAVGHTLIALVALAVGATIYRYRCPEEIQENTEVKWVRELRNPQIEYRALSSCSLRLRWASGVFYFCGAFYILLHIIWRIGEALQTLFA